MAFLVRVEAVQRVSEYNGTNQNGEAYCIAQWKVKNVQDNTIMLVSCFTKDDDILKSNPGFAMDATLTIVCKDWSKDGRSGSMNNVNLTNIVGPEKEQDIPVTNVQSYAGNTPPINNSLKVPDDDNGLPF